jgi:HD-GYP domain-containing protein (c-di-GMP phosphodiesterase class II)
MKVTENRSQIDEAGAAEENAPQTAIAGSQAELLGKMVFALFRGYNLYPPKHPKIRVAAERLLDHLRPFFKEVDRVTVGFIGQDLLVMGKRMYRLESSVPGLNQVFHERGIEKIVFSFGIVVEELEHFFLVLSRVKEADTTGELDTELTRGTWRHISTGRFSAEATLDDLAGGDSNLNAEEARTVRDYLEASRELITRIQDDKLVDYNLATEIVETILNGLILDSNAIPIMAHIKSHDPYTFTHILNVSTLCMAMGRVLGLNKTQLREFGLAALLHDAGKALVPVEILQKTGRLTDEEFDVMRQHPVHGASMLMNLRGMPDLVPLVALEHHIHCDGSGYPLLYKNRITHLCSRIATIADIFDALRTIRIYRGETSKQETLEKMSGMPVDPFLFNIFARISNLYEPGEYVLLDTSEVGVVHEINPQNAFRPKVRLLFDTTGMKLSDQRIVNLTTSDAQNNRFLRSVSSVISQEEMEKLG